MQNDNLDDFKLYPKRFLIVFLFAFSQFTISVLLNTLNPIASYLCIIYNQTSSIVNLGGLLFTLMHPIFTFPASYVIDTYGTRTGIALGSALALVGVCLRLLINQDFGWVIAGQVVAGIGRPFILNCQAKISANWFSSKTRGKVTQILTLVLNVSLVIGMLIPGFVFKGYQPHKGDEQNISKGKQITFKLLAIQAIIAFLCLIPNIFFQKSKPPTPPSDAGNIQRQPFKIAIPKMLKNRSYILLLIAFGCYFGVFNAISITLSFLIQPFFEKNILPLAVAAVGGSPVISGIIGVMIIGPLQRKQGVFKKWIIICMCGSILADGLFYPFLMTEVLALASFISAFNSFFLIPLVPIMLELGCELVFPVGQGSAVGLLFACGNFGGFILGLIMTLIVKGETKQQTAAGLGFCGGVFILGLILMYFMKEERNREKAEQEQQEIRRGLRGSVISNGDSQIITSVTGNEKDDLKQSLLNKSDQQNLENENTINEKYQQEQVNV